MAPLPAPNELGKRTEIKLLEPRFARLSEEQRREAVALLADLLLAAEAKRRGVASGGVSDGASDGVKGSVIPLPRKRRKGRDVA